MARKGTLLERRIILNEYWRIELENLDMAKAADLFMNSGLIELERSALSLTAAIFSEHGKTDGKIRPKANA